MENKKGETFHFLCSHSELFNFLEARMLYFINRTIACLDLKNKKHTYRSAAKELQIHGISKTKKNINFTFYLKLHANFLLDKLQIDIFQLHILYKK